MCKHFLWKVSLMICFIIYQHSKHHTVLHALMFPKASFTSLSDHCWSVWCFLQHPLNTVNLLQLFSDVAYKARDREDLIAGIDEFLDEVIVLPPGEWDPKIRIEPPKKVLSADKRWEFNHQCVDGSLSRNRNSASFPQEVCVFLKWAGAGEWNSWRRRRRPG